MQAEAVFPLNINDNTIYSPILQYQSHMDSVIEGLKCVCWCRGLFVLERKSQLFAIDNCLICNSITLAPLVIFNVNSCLETDQSLGFFRPLRTSGCVYPQIKGLWSF